MPEFPTEEKSCAACVFRKTVLQGALWWQKRVDVCCHPAALADDGRAVTTCLESVYGLNPNLCCTSLRLFRPRYEVTPRPEDAGRAVTIKVVANTGEALTKVRELTEEIEACAKKLAALKENNNVQ